MIDEFTKKFLAAWFDQQPGETLSEAMERRMKLRAEQSGSALDAFRKAQQTKPGAN